MPMCDAYIPEGPPHPRRARTVGQDPRPLARRSFAQSSVTTTTGCSVFVTRMLSFTGPLAAVWRRRAGLLGSGELTRQWPLIADVMCSRRDGHVQARLQEEASEDATIVQINPSSKQ